MKTRETGCPICGYHKRGKNHDEGTHHKLHEAAPTKYLPGTQTPRLLK